MRRAAYFSFIGELRNQVGGNGSFCEDDEIRIRGLREHANGKENTRGMHIGESTSSLQIVALVLVELHAPRMPEWREKKSGRGANRPKGYDAAVHLNRLTMSMLETGA